MRARRKLVDQPRHDFLARAAFAQHQDRDVDVRHQSSLRTKLPHYRTGGDKENFIADFFHFARIILLIGPQTLVDHRVQFALLKRFGQVIVRAQTNCLYHLAGVAHAGEHHNFDPGMKLPQLFQGFEAVDAGHKQVEQDQVGTQTLLHSLQRFFAGAGGLDFVVVHFEQGSDVAQHSGFVVDEQNVVGRSFHLLFPGLTELTAELTTLLVAVEGGRSGRMKENLQPAPGSLSTQILPPIPPTRRRAIARPSPIPA
jgi:hypothetical protein